MRRDATNDDVHGDHVKENTDTRDVPKQPPVAPGTRGFDYQAKIIVLGDPGQGKGNLINVLMDKPIDWHHHTIGCDFDRKLMQSGPYRVQLVLWRTAGQERFRSLTKMFFRKATGVMLVFDVTNKHSFLTIENWLNMALEHIVAEEMPAMMLVGSKTDMTPRAVSTAEASEWAAARGFAYRETSIKTRASVIEAFQVLTDAILASPTAITTMAPITRPVPSEPAAGSGCTCG